MDEMALISAIGHMLDEKLQPIHSRLDRLEETTKQLSLSLNASGE